MTYLVLSVQGLTFDVRSESPHCTERVTNILNLFDFIYATWCMSGTRLFKKKSAQSRRLNQGCVSHPHSGIHVSKKQNVSSLFTRKDSISWGGYVTEE